MAEIVNLNRHRKIRARAQDKARADANAARFGQTKAERRLDAARRDKAERELEAHRRSSEATSPEGPAGT